MKHPIIFSDFDGTLTNNGQIGREFFDIIELIQESQSELVIVSGRSTSWGHFLLTHFPIKAAIMEGGGVIISNQGSKLLQEDFLVCEEHILKLEEITQALKNKYPECPLSNDSFGRVSDRAVELHEISAKQKKEIFEFLETTEAHYSASNVHINFWVGKVSKFNGIKAFTDTYRKGIDIDDCLFFGDALNDETVFEGIKHSVGVSNIRKYINHMKHKPSVVLQGEENEGARGVLNYLRSLK